MEELLISEEDLSAIVLDNKRPEDYAVKNYITNKILTHSDPDRRLIEELLKNKYPSEPDYIIDYRIANFSQITRTYFSKIVNTLAKIDRADDFVIKYTNTKVRDYCENEIKTYKSVRNWFFSIGLKALLTHPNGVICVFPEFNEEDQLTYPQPYIYKTENVIIDNCDFVLVYDADESAYFYFDKYAIYKIELIDKKSKNKNRFSIELVFEHNTGILPVIKLGGVQYDIENQYIFESFVSGVIPFWDQALIEYSDKQVGIKQHLFPEKWRIVTGSCPDCKGTGFISYSERNGSTTKAFCKTCAGSGDPPTGMFSEIKIEQGTFLDGKTPIPPVGYVEKSFEAIEYLDKDIYQNIYAGLAAINMEFIAETPLNQSGVAKEYDRQELNAFIYQVARHIVNNILTPVYESIISQLVYNQSVDIKKLMPEIGIPVHYDFTTAQEAEVRFSTAKNSNVSSSILVALEKKYIEKAFENFKDDKNYLLLINKLDPVPQKSVEDKLSLLDSSAITYQDYVCSSNIDTIIKQAMNKYSGFFNYDYQKQLSIIYDFTNKLISDIKNEDGQETEAIPQSAEYENGDGSIYEQA